MIHSLFFSYLIVDVFLSLLVFFFASCIFMHISYIAHYFTVLLFYLLCIITSWVSWLKFMFFVILCLEVYKLFNFAGIYLVLSMKVFFFPFHFLCIHLLFVIVCNLLTQLLFMFLVSTYYYYCCCLNKKYFKLKR